jgi:acylphosphatase
MHRRIYHFSGRVQGVGFRYTTHNLALRYDVHGYVRNTADGGVEVVMEGPDGDMDQLQQAIEERLGDYIRKTTVENAPATGEFAQFHIRH